MNWVASQELSDRFAAPLLTHDFDHPAISLNGSIGQAMADTMRAIPGASDFQVETCDAVFRPLSLRVQRGN